MVNATPQPLYPREGDPVPTDYEAGWAPAPPAPTMSCGRLSKLPVRLNLRHCCSAFRLQFTRTNRNTRRKTALGEIRDVLRECVNVCVRAHAHAREYEINSKQFCLIVRTPDQNRLHHCRVVQSKHTSDMRNAHVLDWKSEENELVREPTNTCDDIKPMDIKSRKCVNHQSQDEASGGLFQYDNEHMNTIKGGKCRAATSRWRLIVLHVVSQPPCFSIYVEILWGYSRHESPLRAVCSYE